MSVGIMSGRAGLKSVYYNGVRQGGILSPFLFCVYIIYVDELSRMLNNVGLNAGCFVGASIWFYWPRLLQGCLCCYLHAHTMA